MSRSMKHRGGLAAATGLALLAGGCSSVEQVPQQPVAPITPVEPPPAARLAPPRPGETADGYRHSPQRNEVLARAASDLGHFILQQSHNPINLIGIFDTFCSTPGHPDDQPHGRLADGYHPTPGQVCTTTHDPKNGGKNVRLEASAIVGESGQYQVGEITGTRANALSQYEFSFTREIDNGEAVWQSSSSVANDTPRTSTSPNVSAIYGSDMNALGRLEELEYGAL